MSLLRRKLLGGKTNMPGSGGFNALIFSMTGTGTRSFTVSLTTYGGCSPNLKYYSSGVGVEPTSTNQFATWNYSAITVSGTDPRLYFIGTNPGGISSSETKYCTFTVTSNTTGKKVRVHGKLNAIIHPTNTISTVPCTFCFYRLFRDQTAIELNMASGINHSTDAPLVLASTVLKASCYRETFQRCTGITGTTPDLPGTSCPASCYQGMFQGCTGITAVGIFGNNSTNITNGNYACNYMFQACTGLTSARIPVFSNGTQNGWCYQEMFSDCTNLTTLNFTQIGDSTHSVMSEACRWMFQNCTSLRTAPALPSKGINGRGYQYMFAGCTSLIAAPALPATAVNGGNDYGHMFFNCTSLTTPPPTLPATTSISTGAYEYMFYGCTSLTSVPAIQLTSVTQSICQYMFYGCTSITTSPHLKATSLSTGCYNYMFYGCSNLNQIRARFTTTPSTNYTKSWVDGVSSTGTFYKFVDATWNVTGVNGVPSGWTVQTYS